MDVIFIYTVLLTESIQIKHGLNPKGPIWDLHRHPSNVLHKMLTGKDLQQRYLHQ